MWDKIADMANEHGYMSGVDRMSDRVKDTGEVFTPTELVIEMVKQIDIDLFAPGKTVLDPACGDGQFLIVALGIKMFHHKMEREDALKDIYGVDIMRDNVDMTIKRLGGGNVIMGNTLAPLDTLEDQTEEEVVLMRQLYNDKATLDDFFG